MIARLRATGLQTDDEPRQEDFGWYFQFEVPGGRHCCVLGYQEDDPEGRSLQDILGRAPEIRELEWQEASRK